VVVVVVVQTQVVAQGKIPAVRQMVENVPTKIARIVAVVTIVKKVSVADMKIVHRVIRPCVRPW